MLRFDEGMDHWVLWENDDIRVVVQRKTNFPAEYGGHVVVEQKMGLSTPYSDYGLFAKMSVVAAIVQKAIEEVGVAPHANIQSNANWAFRNQDGSFRELEEGRKVRGLHLHVYGRRPEDPGWGEPVRPAYHREQQEGKYWGMIWPQNTMERLSRFITEEVRATGVSL